MSSNILYQAIEIGLRLIIILYVPNPTTSIYYILLYLIYHCNRKNWAHKITYQKWQNAGNDVGIKKDFMDDGLETLLLQLFFEFTYITCNNVMFMLNGHNRRKTFFIIEAIWRGRRRTSGGNLDMYSPLCIYNDTSLLYACTVVFFSSRHI